MSEIVTVPKITVANPEFGSVIRPDTTASNWRLIEERETEFVIEILD